MNIAGTQIKVGLAVESELDAVRALLLSVYAYDPRWHADIDDLRGTYLARDDQALFVARDGEAVVGAAVIRHRLPPAPWLAVRYTEATACELGRVAVAPAYRRQGLALRLVEAARVWAHSLGFAALNLHTDADNAPALALWRAVGNEIVHGIPADWQNEFRSVFFEIPIALPVRKRGEPARGGYHARLARPEDLGAARALMLRVLEEDYGYGYRPKLHADMDDLETYYLQNPRQALAVATDDATGELIALGCIQLGGRFPQPRPDALPACYPRDTTAEMTRIFAAREHRRRGAARDVVEVLRRWAATEGGYGHVVLHTNTGRDGAEAFWRSMATEIYDARPTTFNTVHFELPLQQAVLGSHPERIDEEGKRA